MRELFTAASSGMSNDALRWAVRTGVCQRVQQSIYARGPERVTPLDRERARGMAADGTARGALSGVLHGLNVELDRRPLRRRVLPPERIVCIEGIRCADVVQTLVDLSATLDDDRWEQALESALRRRLVRLEDLPSLPTIRRVLKRRPPGAPPTESLLETLAVQLARTVANLGEPERQVVICDAHGMFVARVDLAWPARRIFLELDGQQHKEQPVYDARRETAVVAATGWLPIRAAWREVTRIPKSTARRWEAVARWA